MSNTKILKPRDKAVQNRISTRYVAIKNYNNLRKNEFFFFKNSRVLKIFFSYIIVIFDSHIHGWHEILDRHDVRFQNLFS